MLCSLMKFSQGLLTKIKKERKNSSDSGYIILWNNKFNGGKLRILNIKKNLKKLVD